MVDTLELACLLDGADVLRLLHHADHAVIARVTPAVHAGIALGDVIAHRTVGDTFLDFADRVRQPVGFFAWRLEDVERETLGALGPDAWQPLQFFHEPEKGIRKRHVSS